MPRSLLTLTFLEEPLKLHEGSGGHFLLNLFDTVGGELKKDVIRADLVAARRNPATNALRPLSFSTKCGSNCTTVHSIAPGMLAEQFAFNELDVPRGRNMSDVSSMFILYILEFHRWAGDSETVRLYWPTVKRAAQWQMAVSARLGVPERLVATYDILQFEKQQVSSLCASKSSKIKSERCASHLHT